MKWVYLGNFAAKFFKNVLAWFKYFYRIITILIYNKAIQNFQAKWIVINFKPREIIYNIKTLILLYNALLKKIFLSNIFIC